MFNLACLITEISQIYISVQSVYNRVGEKEKSRLKYIIEQLMCCCHCYIQRHAASIRRLWSMTGNDADQILLFSIVAVCAALFFLLSSSLSIYINIQPLAVGLFASKLVIDLGPSSGRWASFSSQPREKMNKIYIGDGRWKSRVHPFRIGLQAIPIQVLRGANRVYSLT